jgi:hypothetical protein
VARATVDEVSRALMENGRAECRRVHTDDECKRPFSDIRLPQVEQGQPTTARQLGANKVVVEILKLRAFQE